MGRALYGQEPVFKTAVDTCSIFLKDNFNFDLTEILYPNQTSSIHNNSKNIIHDTQFTQPALFVVEYALCQLWLSWGIRPDILCGHSIGEFVAAHIAGIFSLEDALKLVAIRGKLVSALPEGNMLSIRMSTKDVEKILPEQLSIAASNSDHLCVVAGTNIDIESFAEILKLKRIPHLVLATSHAFHSIMMEPVLQKFKEEVEKVELNSPKIPIISTVTGKKLKNDEARSFEYWANHLRNPVLFSEALDTILQCDDTVFLEVGPGKGLCTFVKQKKKGKQFVALSSLPGASDTIDDFAVVLDALGKLWEKGIEPDWNLFYSVESPQKVGLPTYVFDRQPCWIDLPAQSKFRNANKEPANTQVIPKEPTKKPQLKKQVILKKIHALITDSSGIELEPSDYNRPFLELGLDSLILTQMSINFKNEFQVPITFRQLNEQLGTAELLANYLDENVASELFQKEIASSRLSRERVDDSIFSKDLQNISTPHGESHLELIAQQIRMLGKQVELLQKGGEGTSLMKNEVEEQAESKTLQASNELTEEEKKEHLKPFGASPHIEKDKLKLTKNQEKYLDELITNYTSKTGKSKSYTQKHRSKMADPRVVTGFKPATKELVYPLVVEKSSGSRLWDIDGNEYLDVLNGFGSCIFGHQADFIASALQKQIQNGFEIGPQHPLSGEVCELLCELTKHDRAALCNTGSEAVLGAMRIARTITGRSLIISFTGAYHGINDEALVRGSQKLKTFPAAAGIQPGAVQNMLILEYGTEKSLQVIRERAHEVAAILVEPVQSRRPEFQPVQFLKEVREITLASKAVLIFDEIITGFRMHPGGAQSLFDIKADLATYGKVIGGGMPIGAIVGKKKFMDALDGGFWEYGDSSYPEVGVTYFAGTFVRHPLALAAAKATLLFFKEEGENFQKKLNTTTNKLASTLNSELKERSLPIEINNFGSLWRVKFQEDIPYSELLFVLLRQKGIHIWEGFPCFLTAAFTQDDIDKLINDFTSSIDELVDAGFLPMVKDYFPAHANGLSSTVLNKPPVNGAKLGRDENGDPAWFIKNNELAGGYLKIKL